MRVTYLNMKNLIEKKHYADKEKVMSLLNLFVMMEEITQEEYMELALLASDKYAPENPALEVGETA